MSLSVAGERSAAYDVCFDLASAHYENFPVASMALPPDLRPHIAAVYAFARVADDLADEGDATPEERRAQLADWQHQLHMALALPMWAADQASRSDQIIAATRRTIRERELPVALFDDLIDAFTQDTYVKRYHTWADLLDYCRRSANPVGRLVLRIARRNTPELDASSDALCTALQLTNFWQDFSRDWKAGRLYVPREAMDACGAREDHLLDDTFPPSWCRTMAACVGFTRSQFDTGRLVCREMTGRIGFELRLTWHGGSLILDRVEALGPTLRTTRPALGVVDWLLVMGRTTGWSLAGR